MNRTGAGFARSRGFFAEGTHPPQAPPSAGGVHPAPANAIRRSYALFFKKIVLAVFPFRHYNNVCRINRIALAWYGNSRTKRAKGRFSALVPAFRHCCNADFHGSAAALPWKMQGFWTISSKTLALEQSL